MARILPVILCGGSGTRLWPLSRANHPKQFVDLGGGHTLFGDTVARLKYLPEAERPICVCNEKHRFHVSNLIKDATLILEPGPRNTAPAIGLACMAARKYFPGSMVLSLPADHRLKEAEQFAEAVMEALPLAEQGRIVVFGVKPDNPSSELGYIRAGGDLGHDVREVLQFVEKPERTRAEEMLGHGGYYWNAGIFLADPEIMLQELEQFAPEIFRWCGAAYEGMNAEGDILRPGREEFLACPADSIDYAVMEHTRLAAVKPVDWQWSDMGSFEAFWAMSQKDGEGNALMGNVLVEDSSNSYIHAGSRLVTAIGVDNLTIVETPDAVLVAARDQAAKVKGIVDKLARRDAAEAMRHRLVWRPWGSYEILAEGERFQVKRIMVRPGESLSLQLHHHRAEHWIVVSGTAEVTCGGQTAIYTENQSTYIPVGCKHKLGNPGIIPLVMIEIQSGSYLGEDDIVRLEDVYDRQGQE